MTARPRALAAMAFALAAYALFLAASVTFFAFLGGAPGWRGVDHGAVLPPRESLRDDLLLLLAFGLPHSVMARAWFKRRWTRLVPPVVERATYVVVASASLLLVALAWRPVPAVVWSVDAPAARLALDVLYWGGAALVVYATFAISHAELLGLDRPWGALTGTVPVARFRTPLVYRLVRHPMQLGFLLTFWATPLATVGRILLAAGLTIYVLVGIRFEERDLLRTYGDAYADYRRRVPMLLPRGRAWLIAPVLAVVALALMPTRDVNGRDAPVVSGIHRRAVVADGLARTYLLRVPERPAAAPALVVALHGAAGDGRLMRALVGDALERWADRRGALVVYPDGVGRTRNDCRRDLPYEAARREVDDVALVRTLAADVARAHRIDTTRVLVLGFSNGGHLALRLALEAPGTVGAVAAIGASVPDDTSLACAPGDSSGVAVLLVNGTRDPINPFAGGPVRLPTGNGGGAVRSVPASARWLAVRAGHVASVGLPDEGHVVARRLLPMSLVRRDAFDAVEKATAFFDEVVSAR